MSEEVLNDAKLDENPSSGNRIVSCEERDK
jgi:hypothetical protein